MQSDFSYSKIVFPNLCKSIHDVIIIPVLSIPLKTVERKWKKIQKTEYIKNKKSLLDEMKKKHFS